MQVRSYGPILSLSAFRSSIFLPVLRVPAYEVMPERSVPIGA
jgi:hypothetical protein